MSLSKKLLAFVVIMIVVIVFIMTYKHILVERTIYEDALAKQISMLQKNMQSEARSTIFKLKDEVENDLSSFNLSHINREFIRLLSTDNIVGIVLFNNNLKVQYSVGDVKIIPKEHVDTLSIQNMSDKFIISAPIIISKRWGSLSMIYSKDILNDTTREEKKIIEDKINKSILSAMFTSFYLTVFFLIIAYILVKKLIRPVVLLTDIAKSISYYNLDEINKKFKNIDTNDEVGTLSKAFYEMILRVQSSYLELNELNNSLELKVQRRTKQLDIAKLKAEESTELKSEFLANMSHEIRTPMNGIIGMTHLLKESNLNKQQNTYAKKIDNSAKNLLRIINDILDFSKIEAGMITIEKVYFQFTDIIENAIDLVSFQAKEKEIELIVDIDDNISKYYDGDSLRLSQILLNLLSNAIKFTDVGKVSLKIRKIDNKILRFIVEDTGIGLSEDEQKNLFQSFSQADGSISREYGGTGLGLSISKQLIELMDGKIWIESKKGVGSKFIFEIRLDELGNLKTSNHILKNTNERDDIFNENEQKLDIDTKLKQKLFEKLLDSIKTSRPKNCENVMNELKIYKFNDEDSKLIKKIKSFIQMYKFKEAQELLEKQL